jgi:hypothetical protein
MCFRILCLKSIDTGASSWLFYFCNFCVYIAINFARISSYLQEIKDKVMIFLYCICKILQTGIQRKTTQKAHTQQESRVESIPVQSDLQRRGSNFVAYLKWQPRQCVPTSRVESSPTSLAESSLDVA